MKPTTEQEIIIRDAIENKRLKINAAAGSGKTSTLVMVANAIPKPSLYLAFNKAIAAEASHKFPSHVECKTTHALAYRSYGVEIAHKLSRPKKYRNVAGTPSEIALYYKLSDVITQDDEEKVVSSNMIGMLIRDTVKRFEQSKDDVIQEHHVPYRKLETTFTEYQQRMTVLGDIVEYAESLWKDRKNPHSPVLATHNTYLKLFQLSKPKLEYDVIYVDELQDSSDVVIDIFLNQGHAKLIAVGDTYQAIYGWNGAVNAMDKLHFPQRVLSKSFRFGEDIAEVAKAIIQGGIDIAGNEAIESKIDYVDEETPYTIVFRTNAGLLQRAVELTNEGYNISVEIDTKDFIKLLWSAIALHKGDKKKVKHDTLIPYTSWKDFVEAGAHDNEAKKVAKIINENKAYSFIDALEQVKRRDDAQIVLTTCHKSKGREWDNVVLADDFKPVNEETSQEEINLLYVACTRAQKVLEVNGSVVDAIKLYREKVIAKNNLLRKPFEWDNNDE